MDHTRIHVCGTSGSGKTTLASRLAAALDAPHIELDALWHRENWTTAPVPEFLDAVARVASEGRWVVDGNYTKARPILWSRVQLVIWLDYPLIVILWRVARRTFRRAWKREVLWGVNRERLWRHLFVPKDSLFWWVLKTFLKNRRTYARLSKDSDLAHVEFLRFRSPAKAEAWLEGVDVTSSR